MTRLPGGKGGTRTGAGAAAAAAAALALALALAACSGGSAEAPPPAQDLELATGAAGGLAVRLLGAAPLQVGLDALALEVSGESGALVTDAALELLPLLTTGEETARCPVIGPAASGADGRYPLHAVFQAASGAGTWSAVVVVSRGGTSVAVPLSTLSVATGKDLARSFEDATRRYVLALEFQQAPKVGLNPVVVTLHETLDLGMTFTPVSDATLVLDPQMPSMGHGSPGSVDPVVVAPGWYEGLLSFSMTGEWVVTVTVSRGEAVLGAPELTVRF